VSYKPPQKLWIQPMLRACKAEQRRWRILGAFLRNERVLEFGPERSRPTTPDTLSSETLNARTLPSRDGTETKVERPRLLTLAGAAVVLNALAGASLSSQQTPAPPGSTPSVEVSPPPPTLDTPGQ
jgi:hypothetical protein